MIGEEYLEDDFKTASTAMITIENMPTAQILSLKEKISAVDGVDTVMWISDMLDVQCQKKCSQKISTVFSSMTTVLR